MAITVTIAASNKTAFVYRPEGGPPSLRLTMQLGSDWICEFPLYDTDSTSSAYRPALGQAVTITDGGTTIFHGTISRIEDQPLKGTGSGTLSMVSARAYSGVVDQIVVNQSGAAGFTLEDWVDNFIANYLTAYGITKDATMATGATLEAQTFVDVTLREALNHLSEITGWVWRITPSDELQFFSAGTKGAGYSLTAANKLSVGPVTWSTSREKYVNSVTVRYGTGTEVLKTQTITGDGVTIWWTLDYDSVRNASGHIVSAGYVTDNGVFSPLSEYPSGGTNWQFSASTNEIGSTAGALGVGIVATFVYSAKFPQTVSVEDAGEVASNGRYSGIFEAPDIFDKLAASELALGLLRRYTAVPQWVKISTRQAFVMPGDQITLTFADRIIGGNHLITEVRGSDVFMNGHMQYDLTCLSGDEKQETFTEQLRDILGSAGGARSAGGTISGSVIPNTSGHFDSDVSAWTGFDLSGDGFESKLTTYQNSAGEGPALQLGRDDADYRWVITADSDNGASPGTVAKLRFHIPRRGSSIECAMYLAEDTSDNFMLLPGANANLYLGDYAALVSGLSAGDSRIEGLLCADAMATSGYFERSRTTRMGEWINVSFSAGNFTASGSMTWTVASGDQISYQYALIGKTLLFNAVINTSTVGGTPSTELRIAIPGGFTAAKYSIVACGDTADNGTAVQAFAQVAASGTVVAILKSDGSNWGAATDTTRVRVSMAFEVT